MSMLNKHAYALVAAGLIAVGAPAASHASALATSTLDMTNFEILHSNGTIFDTTDFNPLVPASSASISAAYNSAVGTTAAAGPSATGQIDLSPVCQGPDCPGVANNTFPALTAPPTANFVAADQNESGAPVSGLKDAGGNPISTGATVQSGSWAVLAGQAPGPNTSSANNQLNSSWRFALAGADSMTFKFDASLYQEAFTSLDSVFPSSAQTSSQFFIKITDQNTGAVLFNWSPNGVNGDGVGATAESDPFDLNAGISRNSPFNGQSLLPGETAGTPLSGSFSATTGVLAANDLSGNPITYRLDATLKTTAAAVSVPEPGILALMGIGLVGMAATQRFRGKKLAI